VLLVDNPGPSRDRLEWTLAEAGYQVEPVDAAGLWASLERELPELVVADARAFEGEDTQEVLAYLQQRTGHVPAILLTDTTDFENALTKNRLWGVYVFDRAVPLDEVQYAARCLVQPL
jgi:DNA-binding NtrC family response regulator